MTITQNQRFLWEGLKNSWSQLPEAEGEEDVWLMHNLRKNPYQHHLPLF